MTPATAEWAVASIRRWWDYLGSAHSPQAKPVLSCADGGGSTGSRVRGGNSSLHRVADQRDCPIPVCHYPPGTCQGNKSEHRLFACISLHWKGEPLSSYETVVQLISTTTTPAGVTRQVMRDETP